MHTFSGFLGHLSANLHITVSTPLTAGTHIKATAFFPSKKNQKLVGCQSQLQTQACLYFEHDQNTVAYEPRPFSVYDSRLKVSCTADAIALGTDGIYRVCLVDRPNVPGSSIATRMDALANELEAIAVPAIRLGIDRAWSPAKLRNLRYLYHQAWEGNAAGASVVATLLEGNFAGTATIKALIAEGAAAPHLAYGLFHRMFHAGLEHPVSPRTLCWVN